MRLALHTLLLCSGAAGLIYEVCWSRQLGLWLGHGERGAALTLAVFFLGMAAGYALAARLTNRSARVLRAYAGCEAVIALSALGLPVLAGSAPSLLWLALLLPTCAMGASLPFVLEAVALASQSIPRAYAVHLLGATAGSLLTIFTLIERLGVWHSTYAAAALSGGCALLAYALPSAPAQRHRPASPEAARPIVEFQWAAALAGMATLALEVLALRLFALTFHNSTYTFGLTVAAFIVCLALGSRSVSKRLQHDSTQGRVLAGRGAALAALGVSGMVPLFAAVTHFGELRAPSFGSYIVLALGLTIFVLAVPVIAAGTLLPALWSAAGGHPGNTVGRLSASNGLGAALGALVASFVLLPRIGLFAALLCVAITYAGLGVWLLGWTRSMQLALAGLVGLSALTLRSSPPAAAGYDLLERWQSPYGWVDLVRKRADGSLSGRLDLHYQLGSSADRARHLSMGSLPLALYGQPERVLFVGLATGMTTSAALPFRSLRQIEVVELVPEVEQLARRFGAYNGHVLDDPRVHLVFDDGRSYLARQGAPFDVIVADLFVPWHSHAGYLYTVEHFRSVRARLTPNGVFAQWLPLWQLGAAELSWIGESMRRAFPHTSVWLNDADPARTLLAFVGHNGALNAPNAPRSLTGARRLGNLRPQANAAWNSDEHPRVEFQAPRTERDQRLLTATALHEYLAAHLDK